MNRIDKAYREHEINVKHGLTFDPKTPKKQVSDVKKRQKKSNDSK